MSDYTPTTDDVRTLYAHADNWVGGRVEMLGTPESRADFDRWLAAHDAEVIAASESRERAEWERAEIWRRKANGYSWALRSIQSEVEAWRNTGLPDDRMAAIALILDTPRAVTPRADRIERGE